MNSLRLFFLLAAAWGAIVPGARADQVNLGASQATASWLILPVSARVAGMGEAFGAMGEDIDTLEFNPAGLTQLNQPQFLLTQNDLFQGMSVEHFSGGFPLSLDSGLGLSFDYFNPGSLDAYTVVGNTPVANGTLNPNAFSAGLGYGLSLGSSLEAGLGIKFIQQNLGGPPAQAVEGNAGVMFHGLLPRLTLGAAVENIGGQLQGADLPSDLKLAVAYKTNPLDGIHTLSFDLDGDFSLVDSEAPVLEAGLEYGYRDFLFLRAGDRVSQDNAGTGLDGLTFGAGIQWEGLRLDYAYMSNGDLGNTQLFSLLIKVGKEPPPHLSVKEIVILDSLKKNVQFEFDKAELAPDFAHQLDQLGDLLRQRPHNRVVLTGYASQEGTPEHNLKLSQQRAEAVRDRLLSRGLPPSQVESLGKGDSNPLVAGNGASDIAANRRVEIRIIQTRPGQD